MSNEPQPPRRRADDINAALVIQRLEQVNDSVASLKRDFNDAMTELKRDVRATLADHEMRIRAGETVLAQASPVQRLEAVEQRVDDIDKEIAEFRTTLKYWMAGGVVAGGGLGTAIPYLINLITHGGIH